RCPAIHRRAVLRRALGCAAVPLADSDSGRGAGMKRVIFACVHNAGRSQMAAAFLNATADPDRARAISAGTAPGPHVHPGVVEAMREVGIDLSRAVPRLLTDHTARNADM